MTHSKKGGLSNNKFLIYIIDPNKLVDPYMLIFRFNKMEKHGNLFLTRWTAWTAWVTMKVNVKGILGSKNNLEPKWEICTKLEDICALYLVESRYRFNFSIIFLFF